MYEQTTDESASKGSFQSYISTSYHTKSFLLLIICQFCCSRQRQEFHLALIVELKSIRDLIPPFEVVSKLAANLSCLLCLDQVRSLFILFRSEEVEVASKKKSASCLTLAKRLVLVESQHFGRFSLCYILVVPSLAATRDHHPFSVILQSRFDPKELPGKSPSHYLSSNGDCTTCCLPLPSTLYLFFSN